MFLLLLGWYSLVIKRCSNINMQGHWFPKTFPWNYDGALTLPNFQILETLLDGWMVWVFMHWVFLARIHLRWKCSRNLNLGIFRVLLFFSSPWRFFFLRLENLFGNILLIYLRALFIGEWLRLTRWLMWVFFFLGWLLKLSFDHFFFIFAPPVQWLSLTMTLWLGLPFEFLSLTHF